MRDVLTETLRVIGREREAGGFHESFLLVADLIREYGEQDLAERLFLEIPEEVPRQVVADLFGILVWSTSDNGASLLRTSERWLEEAADAGRVEVALGLDTYPFRDAGTMERVLARAASRFPNQAQRCRELIEMRRREVND